MLMQWELITNIILITSIVTLGIFFLLGLYQWVSRGSITKVDKKILCMPIPLVLMAITYFIFDKLVIFHTRPNGSGEPSFPSTHTMVVATIFFLTMMVLPKYVKNKPIRFILDILMIVMIGLTGTGRVLSNMHYPVDVIGALAFAFIFTEIYYFAVHHKKAKK